MSKNPNPPPSNCSVCGGSLKKIGRRTADPWPEEEGPLYEVEIYACPDPDCPGSKRPLEYWPELID
jgi:transposase